MTLTSNPPNYKKSYTISSMLTFFSPKKTEKQCRGRIMLWCDDSAWKMCLCSAHRHHHHSEFREGRPGRRKCVCGRAWKILSCCCWLALDSGLRPTTSTQHSRSENHNKSHTAKNAYKDISKELMHILYAEVRNNKPWHDPWSTYTRIRLLCNV
jgi:hypothetical protein